ncbi:hypothetical protein ACXR0M_13790 [Pseudomonas sp. Eth.TT006]
MDNNDVVAVDGESAQFQESLKQQIPQIESVDSGPVPDVEPLWTDGALKVITAVGGDNNRFTAALEFRYTVRSGRIYVLGSRYYITQPSDFVIKDRANINLEIKSGDEKSQYNSPDKLIQDGRWRAYETELYVTYRAGQPLYIRLEIDFDGPGGGGWFWTPTYRYVTSTAAITSPTANSRYVGYPLRVSGTHADVSPITVELMKEGGALYDRVVANQNTSSTWTANFTDNFVPGKYYLVAGQISANVINNLSLVPRVPGVSSPASNTVIASQPITVSGDGYPGALVDLAYPGGHPLKTGILVSPNGRWTTTLGTLNWGSEIGFHTIQRINGVESNWLEPTHKLRLLGPPPLTTHSNNQQVEQQITVGGVLSGSFKGGEVRVYRDTTTTRLGRGNVLGTGGWEATISLTPGPYTIVASHFYESVESIRSAPIRLLVRPPKPTITSELNGETVTLSGTGWGGARMDIHFSGNTTPYLEATVVSIRWTKVVPDTLKPGIYVFSGRQSVSDGGNGRIYNSGWVVAEARATIPTPAPTAITVTVNGQRATFRGRGRQWETSAVKIGIFNNGVALAGVPQADVQTNLNWETTATTDIAPGNYPALTARQWVNNQWSGDSTRFSMTVASPAPVFTNPPTDTPTGQRPLISGNAWPGSAIVLKIPGKPDVSLTATGGAFSQSATEDWAPGTYTLTATAAFGGQTSSVASRTFTVKTPKPVITTAANAEVDLSPVINGTGFKGCWVVIYSNVTHQPVGAGPVGQDGKWVVTLVDQTPGNLTLYAIQQASQSSSNVSDRSDVRTVKVRVAKPGLSVPAPNGRPARESVFSGTGQFPGTVELSIKGQTSPFLKDIEVKADGTWQAKVSLPVGGPVTVEARLRQKNYASDPLERIITVVPAIPVVDTPLDGEALGGRLLISGYGHPGDTVQIWRRGTRYGRLINTVVSQAGTWSESVAHGLLDPNAEGISALASAGSGLDSALSAAHYYQLLKPAPSITGPLDGDWVGVRPQFSGLGIKGASITIASWFNTDEVLAPATTVDPDGRWAVIGTKDLLEGATRVVVRQTVNGGLSEWVESGRFIVERKTADFAAPRVDYPLEGQEVGRRPMFSGTGEPGSEILIVKQGSISTELCRAPVDRDGRWAARPRNLLPMAATPYVYSVRQSRDGAISKWLLPDRNFVMRDFSSGVEPPTITSPVNDPDQVLESFPVCSGRGIPGAGIYGEEGGANNFYGIVDHQGNWSYRIRYDLGTGSHQVVFRQYIDDARSDYTEAVAFRTSIEQLDKPLFTSPLQNGWVSPRAVIRGTAMPTAEVKLYKSGNSSKVWGSGIVDEFGQWLIVTDPLPMGAFLMVARVYSGAAVSPWSTTLSLNVTDIG